MNNSHFSNYLKRLRLFGKLACNNSHVWLAGYVINRLHLKRSNFNSAPLQHLLLVFVDHFEPARSEGKAGVAMVKKWCDAYRAVAENFVDSAGFNPQHTWFYRADYPNFDCISHLNELVFDGFGEIEFHLHHGYDTPDDFSMKLDMGLKWFNRAGAMLAATDNLERRFAYIAGNWALDNGRRKPEFSGVNTELLLLRKFGCYADFTFPAFGITSQPQQVNSIFHAKDTPQPKSYNTGIAAKVGNKATGDLMIFQGPLYIDWTAGVLEYAAIESFAPYAEGRIDRWIKAGVHVLNRPEWVFVKLHTHGMQSHEVFSGGNFTQMLSDLSTYCSAADIQLHYVTAREAYNIVKAAEDGMSGNPSDFRNYRIAPPVNKFVKSNIPYSIDAFSDSQITITLEPRQGDAKLSINFPIACKVRGKGIRSLTLIRNTKDTHKATAKIGGSGVCRIDEREVSLPFEGTMIPI